MKNLLLSLLACALLFTSCKRNVEEDPAPIDTAKKEVITNYTSVIFAGSEVAESVDGTGRNAKFYQINKITADQSGNVYVLEVAKSGNSFFKIRKITSTGVTSTIFNGGEQLVPQRVYHVLDIATKADGSLYALASMVNYTIIYTDGGSKYYQEYGTYKLSGDSLVRVSVSSTIAPLSSNYSWVAAHNKLTNIAVDAEGAVYGADMPVNTSGTAAGTKIYKVTPTPQLIEGNTDGVFPATLTATAVGAVYGSTATGILKMSAAGVSNVLTFPAVKTNFKPKLISSFAGDLVAYGDVYDKGGVFKGTGFYTIKTDGTYVTKSILNNPVSFVSAAMVAGKIYYAQQTTQGGYVVYKVTLD